ncbi:MAG: exodeoxyribonuclease VII large subunit [Anaerolineae bacterium]|nr:exodeoxyribonuclease VII large subunit [Anaerolineae bacterium]
MSCSVSFSSVRAITSASFQAIRGQHPALSADVPDRATSRIRTRSQFNARILAQRRHLWGDCPVIARPDAYTISSLTEYVKALFDADLRLQDLWVQGEVSNFTPARSGHWYFTLKDDSSQLKCVMWRSSTARQLYTPRHGDAIVAHGYVSVYEVGGQYQLYADLIQPAGMGDLNRRFELLKAKLEAEGLFDPARKRPLPPFPRRIGVVTSPDAAAFQDVLNVLRRRFPLAEVILSPTLVQGEAAPPQIVAALEAIDRAGADVILLVRGGGSLEDLWAFNDERVAQAVFRCATPVVSGVGHEVDFTIVDFVSDVRAPTPSAAAEISTPDITDYIYAVRAAQERLHLAVTDQIDERRRLIEGEARLLGTLSPLGRINNTRQRLDDLNAHSARALTRTVGVWRERLAARYDALRSADPRAILARGYAIIERQADGARLTIAAQAAPGDGLNVHFASGRLTARVEEVEDA